MVHAVRLILLGAGAAVGAGSWEVAARTVTEAMAAHDWALAEGRFDAKLKSALPAGKLAEIWTSLEAQVGAFRAVERTTVSEQAALHLVVLTCAFERAKLDVKIALDANGSMAGLFFAPASATAADWTPPGYAAQPGQVEERAISVGPQRLPGKLIVPRGRGLYPVAVLVHGSGPNDEDETVGASKPFRDLALGLAANGVASMRYVKRTRHAPHGFAPGKRYTVKEETIDDARAAVALCATEPRIDSKRIWILGHSLGGYLAPRIAAGEHRVAGVVILAGSTRPMEELIVEQTKYLAPGANDLIARAEAGARAVRDPKLAEGTEVDFLGARLPGSYFLDLRGYDAAAAAAALEVPVFVGQGERDYHVGRADYDGWARALAGRPGAKLKLYPGLNHLFQSGDNQSRPEEYASPSRHVSAEVVDDLAAFIGRAR